jgi:hypothetical protein
MTLATGQGLPAGITVVGSTVYWTDIVVASSLGAVMRVANSGAGGFSAVLSGLDQPTVITSDGANLYWTDRDSPGSVMKLAIGGSTPVTLASGQDVPNGIATDGTNVYWGNTNGGTIMKVPVGGGNQETLATGQAPQYLAVDNTSVYWTNSNGAGAVMKVWKK